MPEARLSRTREAYLRDAEKFSRQLDTLEREHQRRLNEIIHDAFPSWTLAPAEPSDDDLWGV